MKTFFSVATCLILYSVAACSQTAAPENADSIYTSLHNEPDCRTVEFNEDEGGLHRAECKGVGGYKLEVIEGDLRQTVNIIAADGSKTELNLWHLLSGGFSYVGPKAEWRVTGKGDKAVPHALIVRFTETVHTDSGSKEASHLYVIKLTKDLVCITDRVDPQTKDQNASARNLADAAATKPCLEQG